MKSFARLRRTWKNVTRAFTTPALRGGARYTRPMRSKKDFVRAKINPIQRLGGGWEGVAHKVDVRVERGTRHRTITLVEKRFHSTREMLEKIEMDVYHRNMHLSPKEIKEIARTWGKDVHLDNPAFRNPEKQFHMAQALIQANRKHQLGLRLPTTVRLHKRFGRKPSLILTFMGQPPTEKEMNYEREDEFSADRDRQLNAISRCGFEIQVDAFYPMIDPRTKKCVAVLGDFGTVN